jgi:ankyrin repeat protein
MVRVVIERLLLLQDASTSLIAACVAGQTHIVPLLLERGVDVNLRDHVNHISSSLLLISGL